jgi:hypothetical protein
MATGKAGKAGKGKNRYRGLKRQKGKADDDIAILGIDLLRCTTAYQAAEILRRRVGSAVKMANMPESTNEHAAIRLLVGTWEGIATTARMGAINLDRLFRIQPICHMWRELQDAVEAMRARYGADYGANFQWLYEEWEDWCNENDFEPAYVSAMCGGIHGRFG